MKQKAISVTASAVKKNDAAIDSLLVAVGARVRNARNARGVSRRILSDISGVSQRYLAQLESGEGNISIGLLLKIAEALDSRVEWLLAEEEPADSDLATISILLREATKKQRERVLKILDPKHPALDRANRYALIGLRGAGKSTLGKLAAPELGLPFIELNEEIEQASGMPVHEVFAMYGQEGYRRLERQSLERIVSTHNSGLLAVAGGIVEESDTFSYLLQHYHTIWLKAEPEEHMARVKAQGDERPMAGNPNAMKELRNILTNRAALYAQTEGQVDTSNCDQSESLAQLIGLIKQKVAWSG